MALFYKHGEPPYTVAAVHGGPGDTGGMRAVAVELSKSAGILEPIQTALTIDGQVEELSLILQKYAKLPVVLIGHSWGAWLCFILAGNYPQLAKKLVLIGCGPFESGFVPQIENARLSRLNKTDRMQYKHCIDTLMDTESPDREEAFALLGELCIKTDIYEPLTRGKVKGTGRGQALIFQKVMEEALSLRESGRLLEYGKNIKCPVTAIHGDYDPHPSDGAAGPLSKIIKDFKFILLKNCGHYPWLEKNAKDDFYSALKSVLS